MEHVLRNGFNHNGPAVINIFTDPDALAMPPTIKLDQVVGFTNSMARLMLNGKSAQIIDAANSDLKYLKELF